jgi:parallel beta-helix repeat protein
MPKSIKILAAILWIALALPLHATDVAGPVTGVWTAQSSPYFVTDSIYVPAGASLTIEAGVQVIFWGHFKFGVHNDATLKVHGVEGDSVVFTTPWTENGWWGIRFDSSSPACSLAYCVFENGRATGSNYEDQRGGAIYAIHASPTIVHSRFSYCRAITIGGAIYGRNDANLILNHCSFTADTADIGGALYFYQSTPILTENFIAGNRAISNGGGIYCENSAATIRNNTITADSARYGAGVFLYYSPATLTGNLFDSNKAYYSDAAGGGLFCNNSNAIIEGNTFTGNYAAGGSARGGALYLVTSNALVSGNQLGGNWSNFGGAIYLYSSNPPLSHNVFSANYSTISGGALYVANSSHPDMDYNEFRENYCTSPTGKGGALFFDNITASSTIHDRNTFYGNWALSQGGAIYHTSSTQTYANSIFWGNSAPGGSQVYLAVNSAAMITFSDVQGGWPGSGNLNAYPQFADTAGNNLHLAQGSICIDHGDPHAINNDPDFTPADMGCYYFPQGTVNPMTLTLTPLNPPIQIPYFGGTFDYTLSLANSSVFPQFVQLWIDATLAWGAPFGPLVGPIYLSIPAASSRTSQRTQGIPINAPPGQYAYNAYLVVEADTLWQYFYFQKESPPAGAATIPPGGLITEWSNWGDPWTGEETATAVLTPQALDLSPCYPNPFNPETTLRFSLPQAAKVELSVYDVAGRLVSTLVNGWREAGTHTLNWNAQNLPSGIYFARLVEGSKFSTQKMVLLK